MKTLITIYHSLFGKTLIQTNTKGLILKKEDTFDIDAFVDYFNLFTDKIAEISYEILDQNLAVLDPVTGEIMALEQGRTTVIARETGTNKIAVIPLRILENSTIEPMAETNGSHTVMLKVDGTVWCYGTNEYGELGDGTNNPSDEPVKVNFPNGTKIVQIAAGENHTLALDDKGNVWAWGRNNYYQLGTTSSNNSLTPTVVPGLANIRKIACGNNTSYAVRQRRRSV